jgi:hypothetical protein
MRLAEEAIKQAILHPEHEVRVTAVNYWSYSLNPDPAVMPLVIQAVEKYGRDTAFKLLRWAEHLAQTEPTIDWLVNELRADYDFADIEDDNYRSAIALILLNADPELLVPRHADIVAAPAFPEALRGPLDERLRLHRWDWATTWHAFQNFGRTLMLRGQCSPEDSRRLERLIKALARHKEAGEQVMRLLRGQYKRGEKELMQWLDWKIVDLAGEIRLVEAVPYLLRSMDDAYEALIDEIPTALGKIGTDSVVDAIYDEWHDTDAERRHSFVEALWRIHTDHCADVCLELLVEEDDMDVAVFLGHAVLSHFHFEGIMPVRDLVLGDDDELDGERRDLRYGLVAAATVMGSNFPEYGRWHREALATNYGWHDHKPGRLSDSFTLEDEYEE